MNIQIRGIRYHFVRRESSKRLPTVVFLHGFMGSSKIFDPLIKHVQTFCNSVTIDLLGHGMTEGAEMHYRFSVKEQIADLMKLIQEQLPTPVFLYGYSMGARLALNLTLSRPDLIQGLILESGTFGIEVEAERQARQALDATRADQIIGNYSDFLDQWQKMDLFKHDNYEVDLSAIQSVQNKYWMANSLLGFGTGTMPCLRGRLSEIVAPTLLITGELDSKFTHINQVMKKEIHQAELVILPECGHRVHSNAYFEIAEHLKLFTEKHQL